MWSVLRLVVVGLGIRMGLLLGRLLHRARTWDSFGYAAYWKECSVCAYGEAEKGKRHEDHHSVEKANISAFNVEGWVFKKKGHASGLLIFLEQYFICEHPAGEPKSRTWLFSRTVWDAYPHTAHVQRTSTMKYP